MNEIFYDLMLAGIALLLFGPRVMCMYLMAMTAYYMMRTVQIFTNKRRR